MRLYNIRMINSGNFSLANLLLDSDSIQLAGRNNRGKTSLLWTLLMLFVVDRKQATHPDYQLKESLHFYFRDPEKSYIVFEGFDEKQGYFYMLLKREDDSIKYYFVKSKFKEEFLINNGEVLSFQEVLENPLTGLSAPLKDISEILAKTITSKRGEVGFLRLANSKNSKRFSELYKHLFRVSKNDTDLLKNGILVVLGIKDEKIDFGNEIGHSERIKWEKEKREIEGLKKVKAQLDAIKEKRNNLEKVKVKVKSEVVKYEHIDFKTIIEKTTQDKQKKYDDIEIINKKLKLLDQQKSMETENKEKSLQTLAQLNLLLSQTTIKYNDALTYGEEVWIRQEIQNATIERDNINTLIKNLDTVTSIEEVEIKLKKAEKKYSQVKQYLDNQTDLLLMNISDTKEGIALANTLLSDEVKTLDKKTILKKESSHSNNTFSFNDSLIDISSLTIHEIPTREEKEKELEEILIQINSLKEMEKTYNKKEELQQKYQKADKKVDSAKNRLQEVENINKYKKEISKLEIDIQQEKEKQHEVKEKIKILEGQESTLNAEIKEIKDSFQDIDHQKNKVAEFYLLYNSTCKDISFSSLENEVMSLQDTFNKTQNSLSILNTISSEFNNKQFELEQSIIFAKDQLRGIEINSDEPDEFISLLDEKCYGLDIAEKEFKEMVKASFHLFFQRIKRFLGELDTVETYIHQINKIISNYSISDLSNVKIIMDKNENQINILKSINSDMIDIHLPFDEFNKDMTDPNDFFNDYIRKEKIINISDLFTINIEREKNNKKEASKQSNGTERMLHVMLLLILMREMINKEDTIPFLIDEVMDIDSPNQAQLLAFFKQLNLLPISASPYVAHEFDKVYRIEEINGKSYLDNSTATWKEKNDGNLQGEIEHV